MIAQFDIYGVYVPTLLVLLLFSYLLQSLLSQLLTRIGFYRWVWHPPLFNLALYTLIAGAVFTLSFGVSL